MANHFIASPYQNQTCEFIAPEHLASSSWYSYSSALSPAINRVRNRGNAYVYKNQSSGALSYAAYQECNQNNYGYQTTNFIDRSDGWETSR